MSMNRADLIEDAAEVAAEIDAKHPISVALAELQKNPNDDDTAGPLTAAIFAVWATEGEKWDPLVDAWKDVLRRSHEEAAAAAKARGGGS